MKKLIALILVIMLNLVILGNSFAWYNEPVKEKTHEEIAKEIWVDLQTLEDINFSFEGYNVWMVQNDKEWREKIKQSIKDTVKVYNDLVNWKEDLNSIECDFSCQKSSSWDNLGKIKKIVVNNWVSWPKNSKFVKNSENKIVWIWFYTAFSQEWIPANYAYFIVTLSKDWTHIVQKTIQLIDLSENKAFQKLNQNPALYNDYGLFEKIFNRLFNIITTNKGINKKIDDFIKETLESQGLN